MILQIKTEQNPVDYSALPTFNEDSCPRRHGTGFLSFQVTNYVWVLLLLQKGRLVPVGKWQTHIFCVKKVLSVVHLTSRISMACFLCCCYIFRFESHLLKFKVLGSKIRTAFGGTLKHCEWIIFYFSGKVPSARLKIRVCVDHNRLLVSFRKLKIHFGGI